MDRCVLVIGYGNVYCHDDGVWLHIVNVLRRLKGGKPLQPDEDGLDDLGGGIDAIMVHQLVPELASVVARYDQVIFVDAHLGHIEDEVRVVPLKKAYRFHAVTHHLSPETLLWMAEQIKGTEIKAYLVSVKGDDFDFGLGLTDRCAARADVALERILDLC